VAKRGEPVNTKIEFEHKDLSKKQFDILILITDSVTAGNDHVDEIIQIAFTQNDFAEVEGKTPLQHLEMYWDVIRSDQGKIFSTATHQQSYDEAKKMEINETADDDDKKIILKRLKKLDEAYSYVKGFIELVFVNVPTTEADFKTWSPKVRKYITTGHAENYKNELSSF